MAFQGGYLQIGNVFRPPSPVSQTEASASVWRGGAIERKQAFAALTATADAQPVRFATTRKPVRSIPTLPPAARFLSRERNRGKRAAGVSPCTPGAQGAEAKGT